MKNIFLIAFCLYINKTFSQSVFITDMGEVTFYSYAPLEDIKATSNQVNSILNVTTGEIAFIIPMRSFHFAKALMQEHFNEKYIESDKFPQATFKGYVIEKIDLQANGILKLTASGKLNIHGKEKEIKEKGELEINGDKITLTTDFNIAIADYGVKIPQLLFNNIADTVNVKIKVSYVTFKKK